MTMQAVAFTLNAGKNSGVNTASGSKGSSEKVSFDKYINSNAGNSSNANAGKTGSQPASKVGVINNGSSIRKSIGKTDVIDSSDINIIECQIAESGKLQVTVIDNTCCEVTSDFDLDALMDEVKHIVSNILNRPEEDVEKVIEEYGLTLTDMLSPQGLQTLLVELTGVEDFSYILVDDSFNRTWNELSDAILGMDIKLNDDITINAEEMSELLAMAENADESLVRNQPETSAGNDTAGTDVSDIGDSRDTVPEVIINISKNDDASQTGSEGSGKDSMASEQMSSDRELRSSRDDAADAVHTGETLFSQFMDRVEEGIAGDDVQNVEYAAQLRDIANQVIDSIRVNVGTDTTGLEIQLHPEHLGKVNVSIEMHDGAATANFIVRNEMARVALESQIQSLKETFEEQGIKVDAVEVVVSDFSSENNNSEMSDNGSGRQGSRRPFRSDEELEAEVFNMQEADEEVLEETGGINIIA